LNCKSSFCGKRPLHRAHCRVKSATRKYLCRLMDPRRRCDRRSCRAMARCHVVAWTNADRIFTQTESCRRENGTDPDIARRKRRLRQHLADDGKQTRGGGITRRLDRMARQKRPPTHIVWTPTPGKVEQASDNQQTRVIHTRQIASNSYLVESAGVARFQREIGCLRSESQNVKEPAKRVNSSRDMTPC